MITSETPLIQQCNVQSYTEKVILRGCSNVPIFIETTRCRGQCYSEDFLVYDWQSALNYYRHRRRLHCCSPNSTKAQETQVRCATKRLRTIKYRLVTQCACHFCREQCTE